MATTKVTFPNKVTGDKYLATEANEVKSVINNNSDELVATANDLATTKTDLATTKTDLGTMKTDLATTKTDVSTAKSDITTAKSDIATLKTDVSTAKSDITTTKTDIATAKTNITTIQSDVTTAKSDITTIKSTIAGLPASSIYNKDVDYIKSYLTLLQSSVAPEAVSTITTSSLAGGVQLGWQLPSQAKKLSSVILGSSTAAANVWPASLETYYDGLIDYSYTNIAQGGFTSFHAMPTGTIAPGYYNGHPDHNIAKALEYKPDFVIINFPSNDALQDFPARRVVDNFHAIRTYALANNMAFFLTTQQPRNFDANIEARKQIQRDINAFIKAEFPAEEIIDLYDDLRTSDGGLNPAYDGGDGTHLNSAGYTIIVNKTKPVIDAWLKKHPKYNSSFGFNSIQVDRKTGSGAYSSLATVSGSAKSYLDASATATTVYSYQIYPIKNNLFAPKATSADITFTPPAVVKQTRTYLVDPASDDTLTNGSYYHIAHTQGSKTQALKATDGTASSIVLTVMSTGVVNMNQGYNQDALGYVGNSWVSGHYANPGAPVSYEFSGLNNSNTYALRLIGSRSTNDTRSSFYTVNGQTQIHRSGSDDGLGNRTESAYFTGLTPVDGKIQFTFGQQTGAFGYLNIIDLTETVNGSNANGTYTETYGSSY